MKNPMKKQDAYKDPYRKSMKFENLYLTDALGAIVNLNTKHYRSDFEVDKKILQEAAESTFWEDWTLLWLSRTHGTYCFRERDVFLKGTRAYHTWTYYQDQTYESMLAYVIEVAGIRAGKITGNLYNLEYEKHCNHVQKIALPADNVKLYYEHGHRVQPANQYVLTNADPRMGKFKHFEEQPNDPDTLDEILQREKTRRNQLKAGDFEEHILTLRRLLET